jgi:hypothetical protein
MSVFLSGAAESGQSALGPRSVIWPQKACVRFWRRADLETIFPSIASVPGFDAGAARKTYHSVGAAAMPFERSSGMIQSLDSSIYSGREKARASIVIGFWALFHIVNKVELNR